MQRVSGVRSLAVVSEQEGGIDSSPLSQVGGGAHNMACTPSFQGRVVLCKGSSQN